MGRILNQIYALTTRLSLDRNQISKTIRLVQQLSLPVGPPSFIPFWQHFLV